MKYFIYQLVEMRESAYGFMSWDFAQTHGFDFKDYAGFYTGEVEQNDAYVALEVLFTKFNIHRPKDFRGHSLSMSDIVSLEDSTGNVKYYYCDRFGWEEITSFIVKKKEEKKPNMKKRAQMVRAMEFIARCINDEEAFMPWLSCGVADGDINSDTTDEDLEYYCKDENFAELMDQFLKVMSYAKKDGGLVCDNIVSK